MPADVVEDEFSADRSSNNKAARTSRTTVPSLRSAKSSSSSARNSGRSSSRISKVDSASSIGLSRTAKSAKSDSSGGSSSSLRHSGNSRSRMRSAINEDSIVGGDNESSSLEYSSKTQMKKRISMFEHKSDDSSQSRRLTKSHHASKRDSSSDDTRAVTSRSSRSSGNSRTSAASRSQCSGIISSSDTRTSSLIPIHSSHIRILFCGLALEWPNRGHSSAEESFDPLFFGNVELHLYLMAADHRSADPSAPLRRRLENAVLHGTESECMSQLSRECKYNSVVVSRKINSSLTSASGDVSVQGPWPVTIPIDGFNHRTTSTAKHRRCDAHSNGLLSGLLDGDQQSSHYSRSSSSISDSSEGGSDFLLCFTLRAAQQSASSTDDEFSVTFLSTEVLSLKEAFSASNQTLSLVRSVGFEAKIPNLSGGGSLAQYAGGPALVFSLCPHLPPPVLVPISLRPHSEIECDSDARVLSSVIHSDGHRYRKDWALKLSSGLFPTSPLIPVISEVDSSKDWSSMSFLTVMQWTDLFELVELGKQEESERYSLYSLIKSVIIPKLRAKLDVADVDRAKRTWLNFQSLATLMAAVRLKSHRSSRFFVAKKISEFCRGVVVAALLYLCDADSLDCVRTVYLCSSILLECRVCYAISSVHVATSSTVAASSSSSSSSSSTGAYESLSMDDAAVSGDAGSSLSLSSSSNLPVYATSFDAILLSGIKRRDEQSTEIYRRIVGVLFESQSSDLFWCLLNAFVSPKPALSKSDSPASSSFHLKRVSHKLQDSIDQAMSDKFSALCLPLNCPVKESLLMKRLMMFGRMCAVLTFKRSTSKGRFGISTMRKQFTEIARWLSVHSLTRSALRVWPSSDHYRYHSESLFTKDVIGMPTVISELLSNAEKISDNFEAMACGSRVMTDKQREKKKAPRMVPKFEKIERCWGSRVTPELSAQVRSEVTRVWVAMRVPGLPLIEGYLLRTNYRLIFEALDNDSVESYSEMIRCETPLSCIKSVRCDAIECDFIHEARKRSLSDPGEMTEEEESVSHSRSGFDASFSESNGLEPGIRELAPHLVPAVVSAKQARGESKKKKKKSHLKSGLKKFSKSIKSSLSDATVGMTGGSKRGSSSALDSSVMVPATSVDPSSLTAEAIAASHQSSVGGENDQMPQRAEKSSSFGVCVSDEYSAVLVENSSLRTFIDLMKTIPEDTTMTTLSALSSGATERLMKRKTFVVTLCCKDGSTFEWLWYCSNEQMNVFFADVVFHSSFPRMTELFAFDESVNSYQIPPLNDGWRAYDPISEFLRQRVPPSKWKLTSVNVRYEYCPSYPSVLCVPKSMDEESLFKVADFRTSRRIPAMTYWYNAGRCALLRSSQPKVGMLAGMGQTITDASSLLSSLMGKILTTEVTRCKEDEQFLKEAGVDYIVDARPWQNAAANAGRGGGYENTAHYNWIKLIFTQIQNIHKVRDSYESLYRCIRSSAVDANYISLRCPEFRSMMEPSLMRQTHWASLLTNGSDSRNHRIEVVDAWQAWNCSCDDPIQQCERCRNRIRRRIDQLNPRELDSMVERDKDRDFVGSVEKMTDSSLINGNYSPPSLSSSNSSGSGRSSPSGVTTHHSPAFSRSSSSKTAAASSSSSSSSSKKRVSSSSQSSSKLGNKYGKRSSIKVQRTFYDRMINSDSFWSELENTQWLNHIKSILTGAVSMASIMSVEQKSVLVHCSDGWDRTSQLAALCQLLLDPYFRTLRGFIVLIEKDFCSFGHKFRDRVGHRTMPVQKPSILARSMSRDVSSASRDFRGHSHKDKPPPGMHHHHQLHPPNDGPPPRPSHHHSVTAPPPPLSSTYSSSMMIVSPKREGDSSASDLASALDYSEAGVANAHYSHGASVPMLNKHADSVYFSHVFEAKSDVSPVFIQFLDCVWQVWSQFPNEFEFNGDKVLKFIAGHVHSCRYGTFLTNNECERKEQSVEAKTQSLWTVMLDNEKSFLNDDYDPGLTKELKNGGMDENGVLFVDCRSSAIKLWPYHLRQDLFAHNDSNDSCVTHHHSPLQSEVSLSPEPLIHGMNVSNAAAKVITELQQELGQRNRELSQIKHELAKEEDRTTQLEGSLKSKSNRLSKEKERTEELKNELDSFKQKYENLQKLLETRGGFQLQGAPVLPGYYHQPTSPSLDADKAEEPSKEDLLLVGTDGEEESLQE